MCDPGKKYPKNQGFWSVYPQKSKEVVCWYTKTTVSFCRLFIVENYKKKRKKTHSSPGT